MPATDNKPDPLDVRIVPPETDIAREIFKAGLTVAMFGIIYWVSRRVSGPDFGRTMEMRAMARVQGFADAGARECHKVSAWAGKRYLASRVTV